MLNSKSLYSIGLVVNWTNIKLIKLKQIRLEKCYQEIYGALCNQNVPKGPFFLV